MHAAAIGIQTHLITHTAYEGYFKPFLMPKTFFSSLYYVIEQRGFWFIICLFITLLYFTDF